MKTSDQDNRDANRDPITGAPGAHPVGTGLGAAAGGMAAGAAAGTVAGPIGAAAGAAAGAVVGGLAGKAVGEMLDPTEEDAYWRENYTDKSQRGLNYDDYAPAYRTGYIGRVQYGDRRFEDAELDLEAYFNKSKGTSRLNWSDARHASRAAWDRADRMLSASASEDSDK